MGCATSQGAKSQTGLGRAEQTGIPLKGFAAICAVAGYFFGHVELKITQVILLFANGEFCDDNLGKSTINSQRCCCRDCDPCDALQGFSGS